MHRRRLLPQTVVTALMVAGGLGLSIAGCGGADESPVEQAQQTQSPPDGRPESAASGQSAARVTTDANGRKWIDNEIPYDVWFHDPLAIANERQTVAAAPSAPATPSLLPTDSSSEETEQPTRAESTDMSSAQGQIDWTSILSPEILEDEVKQIRNRLKRNMLSVGRYNGNYKEIAVDATSAAVIAGIATRHAGSVSWKDKAKYVRALATDIADNATALGRDAYEATRVPFDNLDVVLSGGMPAGVDEPEEMIDFAYHAELSKIMRRMERSQNWLRQEIRSAETFQSEAKNVTHEAALLAAMAKIITTKDYGYEEDQEYRTFARQMFDASTSIVNAVKAENYEAFSPALNTIQQACDECHQAYRFAGEL